MANKWKIKVTFDTMEKEILWKEGGPLYKLKSKEQQFSPKNPSCREKQFMKTKKVSINRSLEVYPRKENLHHCWISHFVFREI